MNSQHNVLMQCARDWRWMFMPLCIALLFSGCSGGLPAPQPLKDLHLSGVTQVPGITTIHPGVNLGKISAVVAYSAAGDLRTPHILFLLDGDLYDVKMDGSALRRIPLTHPCISPSLSVTSDGKWLVCEDDEGDEISALTAQPSDGGRQILPNEAGNRVGDPSWSPDGHRIALVSHQGGGCSIALYATSSLYDHFELSAIIPLPEFATRGGASECSISDLSWSPDGTWIALVVNGLHGDHPGPLLPAALYALHIAPIAREIPALGSPAVTIADASALLDLLGMTGVFAAPSWSRNASGWTITYVDGIQQAITSVDLVTGHQTQVLHIDEGILTTLSWAHDSSHLVFVQNSIPQCLECRAPMVPLPSHLYVYTSAGK